MNARRVAIIMAACAVAELARSTAAGGATWSAVTHPVLRTIRITALRFMPGTSTLVVATYGRGAWSADIPASIPKRRAVRR